MSKPKPQYMGTKEEWYQAGLVDGEKRLAMALKRWLSDNRTLEFLDVHLNDWLTARAKRRKGK